MDVSLLFVIILSTTNMHMVMEDNQLVDGIVLVDGEFEYLSEIERSNNGYFGTLENGDKFYLIITDYLLKMKIWHDGDVVRLIEPII